MICPHCSGQFSTAEMTAAIHALVVAMRTDGASLGDIASATGLGKATVSAHLNAAGLQDIGLRPGRKPRAVRAVSSTSEVS